MSPEDAAASIRPAEDLVLESKHSTAPSSPPLAISPWTLLKGSITTLKKKIGKQYQYVKSMTSL